MSASNRHEAQDSKARWFPCNKGGGFRRWYRNNLLEIDWFNDGEGIQNNYDENGRQKTRPQNLDYQFLEGMTWGTISSSILSMRYSPRGFMFETKDAVCIANSKEWLKYYLALMNSELLNQM